MRTTNIAALVVCLMLVSCTGESFSVRRQMLEKTNVAAFFDNWVRAVSNMERDSVFAMYHQVPELRVFYPDGRVSQGWDEERAMLNGFFDRVEMINLVTRGREVEVLSPSVAVTTFRFTLDALVDGEPLQPSVDGIASITWIKDENDERWKIHTQHASVASPIGTRVSPF